MDRLANSGAVRLECGHRVLLPWGTSPEIGAVVVVHHRAECPDLGRARAAGGPTPWSVRRLEAPR
jgi:hypothetical protein